MKRFFSLFLSFLIAAAIPAGVLAQSTYRLKSVQLTSNSGLDQVTIQTSGGNSFKVQRFDWPDRLVVDIPNTTTGSLKKIKGASKPVKEVRYAQYTKTTARVTIELGSGALYRTEQKSGRLIVYAMKTTAQNMAYYTDGTSATLAMAGAKLLDSKSKKVYTEQYDSSGKKYTITFPSSAANLQSGTVSIKDSFLNTIQVIKNTKTKKTSIVFQTKAKLNGQPLSLAGFTGTALRLAKANTGASRGDDPRETEPAQPTQPAPAETTPTQTAPAQTNPAINIRCYTENGREVVAIPVSGLSDYNVVRLTSPERLVIDFLNKKLFPTEQKLTVDSAAVSTIRCAQLDTYTSRVALDMKEHRQYQAKASSNQLLLYLDVPSYRNISYQNNGGGVSLLMPGTVLTQGDDQQKLYTEKWENNGRKYTVTFASNQADIGTGTIQINDGVLEDIEIKADTAANTTSITFNAREQYVYKISTLTHETTGEKTTVINLLRPNNGTERLVVIDAGHGGSDPGATYAGVKEKDLNLDIALRLNALLKARNIRTYMTREDDTFVPLYQRAYIANQLNASLFVSVHNNAGYTSARGTEVLYYPGGYARTVAQYMQDAMIENLGTLDRKIQSRPGLVVLKATWAPSVLAEVGFITNNSDRQNLQDESFRQKAAQALCDSIMKSLEGMK